MNNPLGVRPSKGKQGTTRGKEKIFEEVWEKWPARSSPCLQKHPQEGHLLSPAQRSMGRRTRGLLPISKELLLPSDNSAEVVRKTSRLNELGLNNTMTQPLVALYLR